MRHLDYVCSPKRCGVKVKREDILVCRDYAAAPADEQQVKKKNASLKDNLLFIAG